MKKIALCFLLIFLINCILTADSANIHGVILQEGIMRLQEYEGLSQENTVLAAIAYKEYLNLLAESIIILSGDLKTEAVLEDLLADFVSEQSKYQRLLNAIDMDIEDKIWHLNFSPPLGVDESLQEKAKAYSSYLLGVSLPGKSFDYQSIEKLILGYLPIAYQTRLLMVSVDPPPYRSIPGLLLSEEITELDLDLEKVWVDLSK